MPVKFVSGWTLVHCRALAPACHASADFVRPAPGNVARECARHRPVRPPDAVILAGDIDTGSNAIGWAARTFGALPVLYVHGNHEGYGHQLEQMQMDVRAACDRANAAGANIRLLDGDAVELHGVRFLGATLWTDFLLFGEDRLEEALSAAQAYMPDYQRISTGGDKPRLLCAEDTAALHARHKAWLSAQLAQPFDGATVVITHMAPSMHSVEGRSPPISARPRLLPSSTRWWRRPTCGCMAICMPRTTIASSNAAWSAILAAIKWPTACRKTTTTIPVLSSTSPGSAAAPRRWAAAACHPAASRFAAGRPRTGARPCPAPPAARTGSSCR